MPHHELAQLNIAAMAAPMDSPALSEFVANLDRINTLAERSEGFVWRLQTEEGDATALRPFGDDYLVNLSVWLSVEALQAFVFRSAHADIMRRRKEWFHRMEQPYTVLWWVPEGQRPTLEEAGAKLALLREQGPTAAAFSFRQPFTSPSASG